MKRTFLISLSLAVLAPHAAAEDSVHVSQEGHRILIDTPSRSGEIYMDPSVESMHGSRIEIPLSALRPKTPPQALSSSASASAQPAPPASPPRAAAPPSPIPDVAQEAPPAQDSEPRGASAPTAQRELPPARPIAEILSEANDLYFKGKLPEAYGAVEEILKRDPRQVRAWLMKGSLLQLAGNMTEARKAWDEARKIDPRDPGVLSIPHEGDRAR